jgi:hypothetical protein
MKGNLYTWAMNEGDIFISKRTPREKGHLVGPKNCMKCRHLIVNESFTIHYDRGCEAFSGLVHDCMTTVNFF